MSNAAAGFAGLKNRRTNYDELLKKFDTKSASTKSDDRFYYPERDKEGTGFALLRFLPAVDETEAPFVEYFSHTFKGPSGKWYWDDCRTSIGDNCPVCEANRALIEAHGGNFKKCPDHVTKVVSSRKRKRQFVSNIYVVKDAATPENEGKVFLFKYGVKIMDKIKEAINPTFEDQSPFDPFNPWQGANFAFKIRKVDGQTNYDSSSFNNEAPLFEDDDKIMSLAESIVPLTEFTDPSNYTDYNEQKAKLARVLGEVSNEPIIDTPQPAASSPPAEVSWQKPEDLETQDETKSTEEEENMDELFGDIPF
jgi:hypothetical protein